MNRARRILPAAVTVFLLAAFGGAVQGVATVQGQIKPDTAAAEAYQRLQDDRDGKRRGDRVTRRMSAADCPWLDDARS